MPDLMVDLIISLDGYAAAEGWPELWGRGGPEYLAFLGEDAETRHTTLLGATTYRMMSAKHGGTPDDPMADLRIFDGDLQLLEYVPTVLDAPPGVGR